MPTPATILSSHAPACLPITAACAQYTGDPVTTRDTSLKERMRRHNLSSKQTHTQKSDPPQHAHSWDNRLFPCSAFVSITATSPQYSGDRVTTRDTRLKERVRRHKLSSKHTCIQTRDPPQHAHTQQSDLPQHANSCDNRLFPCSAFDPITAKSTLNTRAMLLQLAKQA